MSPGTSPFAGSQPPLDLPPGFRFERMSSLEDADTHLPTPGSGGANGRKVSSSSAAALAETLPRVKEEPPSCTYEAHNHGDSTSLDKRTSNGIRDAAAARPAPAPVAQRSNRDEAQPGRPGDERRDLKRQRVDDKGSDGERMEEQEEDEDMQDAGEDEEDEDEEGAAAADGNGGREGAGGGTNGGGSGAGGGGGAGAEPLYECVTCNFQISKRKVRLPADGRHWIEQAEEWAADIVVDGKRQLEALPFKIEWGSKRRADGSLTRTVPQLLFEKEPFLKIAGGGQALRFVKIRAGLLRFDVRSPTAEYRAKYGQDPAANAAALAEAAGPPVRSRMQVEVTGKYEVTANAIVKDVVCPQGPTVRSLRLPQSFIKLCGVDTSQYIHLRVVALHSEDDAQHGHAAAAAAGQTEGSAGAGAPGGLA
ncbi:hypothetical protein MNEG_11127, partial [Monoraphidium neglectum]